MKLLTVVLLVHGLSSSLHEDIAPEETPTSFLQSLHDFVARNLKTSLKVFPSKAPYKLPADKFCDGPAPSFVSFHLEDGCEYILCKEVFSGTAQGHVVPGLVICKDKKLKSLWSLLRKKTTTEPVVFKFTKKTDNTVAESKREMEIATHLSHPKNTPLNKMFMKPADSFISDSLDASENFMSSLNKKDVEEFKGLKETGGLIGIYELVRFYINGAKSVYEYINDDIFFLNEDGTVNEDKITQVASCLVIQKILATLGTIALGYLNVDMHDENFLVDKSAGMFKYKHLECPVIKSIDPGSAFKLKPELTSFCAWLTNADKSLHIQWLPHVRKRGVNRQRGVCRRHQAFGYSSIIRRILLTIRYASETDSDHLG